jgi:2-polyprenyl-3-methyl-5-hydroxy-6-metoxy-1,4-benzoquinol methylase
MQSQIEYAVNKIAAENPVAGKKLKKNFTKFTDEHKKKADEFLAGYTKYLSSINKSIDYAIDCYLKMTGDMFYERIKFLETGRYANNSYKEVEQKVYSNPDVMDYHMHGLILAQFLWPDQYIRFTFFSDNLSGFKPIRRYLEVGGGHGLYVSEAIRLLGKETEFDVVDISQSSLNICKGIISNDNVNFVLKDIFEYSDSEKFDFITIGEVIEHLENPLELLKKLHSMMKENAKMYLTTPVNAPMIDHIYLFNNVDEIKALLNQAGFRIVKYVKAYSDEMPEELAIEHKIPLMYACFLEKK